jgi:hypothetical protein
MNSCQLAKVTRWPQPDIPQNLLLSSICVELAAKPGKLSVIITTQDPPVIRPCKSTPHSSPQKICRNETALLDKPAVAPTSESVNTFENCYIVDQNLIDEADLVSLTHECVIDQRLFTCRGDEKQLVGPCTVATTRDELCILP